MTTWVAHQHHIREDEGAYRDVPWVLLQLGCGGGGRDQRQVGAASASSMNAVGKVRSTKHCMFSFDRVYHHIASCNEKESIWGGAESACYGGDEARPTPAYLQNGKINVGT